MTDLQYPACFRCCGPGCIGTRNASACWPRMSPMPTRPVPAARSRAAELRPDAGSAAARQLSLARTNAAHLAGRGGDCEPASSSTASGGFEVRPGRQCRQPRRRDDEGRQQPDGLPGRDLALHAQARTAQDRARQAGIADAGRGGTMDFLKSIAIAASGLRAQAGRMRVISENIANADSTAQTPGADPYRRKIPTFRSEVDRTLDARVVGARTRAQRSVRLPLEIRARPSGGRRQRLRPLSQRQSADRDDRHARGPALLRGQHQRHRRDPPHDPAHARHPAKPDRS